MAVMTVSGAGVPGVEDFVHQRLTAQGQGLGVGHGGKIHTAVAEAAPQLPQADSSVRARADPFC